MQRDVLLLTEMIDAAEQAQQLATGVRASDLKPTADAGTHCCGTSPNWVKPQVSCPPSSSGGSPTSHGSSLPGCETG